MRRSVKMNIMESAKIISSTSKLTRDKMGELVKINSEDDINLLRCPSTDDERQELADAIFHLRQLMLEANFITDTVSAKVSKRSVLIGREMFKRFMDMFGDVAEEEVLDMDQTTALATPKIKNFTSESGTRTKPATTSSARNKIPYAVKAKAVKLAEQHPRWSINTLRKNSTRFLKDRSQLARWKSHIEKGGTRYDKLAVINKDVYDRFIEAKNQKRVSVTTPLLKEWAMASAAQFLDGSFDFKASDGWIHVTRCENNNWNYGRRSYRYYYDCEDSRALLVRYSFVTVVENSYSFCAAD